VSGTSRFGVPAEVSARSVLADRGGVVVPAVFYLLVSGVLSALWRAAAGEHGSIAGYSATELTWYVVTSEAAICALDILLIERVGDDVGRGAVAVEMLRPAPVVAVRLAVEFGRGTARLVVLVVPGATLAWLTVGSPPRPSTLLPVAPSLALAMAANLCLQHVVAAASFWVRDARATWFIYQKFIFILGGMLLPLEVPPGGLRGIALHLPFMAMAYALARLASGHLEPALLLAQVGWLVVLAALAVGVFAAGQRRLQVVGG
jgi:ABC-2 type transport system permease protein